MQIRTAEALRPKSFDEIVGQKHLFGERGVGYGKNLDNYIFNRYYFCGVFENFIVKKRREVCRY